MENEIISSVVAQGQDFTSNTPEKSPQEVCDRIVVFLDIMGFKDLVARQSETNIKKKLHSLSSFIYTKVRDEDFVQFSIFSDSIILFSNEATKKAFSTMVRLSALIVEKSIELGLPIRGAIAAGECTVTNEKVPYYFGQPIIDAYILEENVVMYGVVLHNTVEKFAVDYNEEPNLIFDYKVVLKGGASKHYVVNWFNMNYEQNLDNLNKIRHTVSDSPRRYIDATIDCFNAIYK